MSADSAFTYSSVHSEARSWSILSEDPYDEAAQQAGIPEADTPPRNRPLLATPRPGCEVGESSAAAAARRPGPTMAHGVDVCTRESLAFCTRHHDAQKDRAAVRAEIEVLRSERLAYEQEGIQTREALARSEAYCMALEARVAMLETHVRRLEWQRQAADDLAVQHIMHTQALEAGAPDDTLEDTVDSAVTYSSVHSEARAWSIPSEALGAEMNAIASSLYHSLHPSGTPPLLPIPLSTPSTSRRAGIPEVDTPPRNRPLLATPRPGCEVGESSAAAAYVYTRESLEFYTRHHDAQKDRAAIRAEIEVLRSERLAYEQEVLETHARRLEWHRQATDDLVVQHIMRTQALEAGARDDTLEDTKNPRNMHTARPYYYADFMKCHPLNFKGIEGAVGLTRWMEKMESVFSISGCAVENQSVPKKKMADKYYPLGEVKKLEIELWNLKVDKYISGLPDNIYGNVKSSKPKTLDETIELANDLMDQKLRTYEKRKSDSKRKADDIFRNNQQPFKKQNVAKAYNLGSAEKKTYEGNAPKSTGNINATNNRGDNGPNPRGNERNGNTAGNPNSNVVMGTFLLNNRYASKLFDTGADKSFLSIAFSSMIDIIPTPLVNHYDVELANGKIVGINTIIRGCTLNFLNHPFTIDLMPVEVGSFNAIIGMDWLRRHHAVIVCDEKLVRVPFGNETLVFRGAESYIGRESRLTVISCSKVQEYMAKGCHVFLAQISAPKEDKSEGKQVKDVSIVQVFPEVFPENLLVAAELSPTSHPGLGVASSGLFRGGVSASGIPALRLVDGVDREAHSSPFSVHPGSTKMYHDLKQYFWWSGMKRDVATFVSKCLIYQQVKIEHQRASGLLQQLDIPVWKWDEISMDFVTGLPQTQRRHDAIWVVVDRLTKSAHFLPIRKDYSIGRLAEIFQQEIIRLHGTPLTIVSDRDPRFASRFWKGLQKAWGTRLKFSTAFHPQIDGQSEHTIQTLEDMLRSCALEWTGNWDNYICLVEFAYNNSWHASIKDNGGGDTSAGGGVMRGSGRWCVAAGWRTRSSNGGGVDGGSSGGGAGGGVNGE
nr:DNA/RNA polymerase superfamily protein [Tanacetum cinerariifolium]